MRLSYEVNRIEVCDDEETTFGYACLALRNGGLRFMLRKTTNQELFLC